MTSAPIFPPPSGIKNSTESTPHPLFLAHQPPPPGLLQILMSAEKCQVGFEVTNINILNQIQFYLS